jgi:phosphomethylpyrimidine synthase
MTNRRQARERAQNFLAKLAQQNYPNSQKSFIKGELHDINVAMRHISQADTLQSGSATKAVYQKNEAIPVYDTSGAYTDPNIRVDVHQGLPKLRQAWIEHRNDTEQLDKLSSEFSRQQLTEQATTELRFNASTKPRRAKIGKNCTMRAKG